MISIIIPVYNEEKNIEQTISNVFSALSTPDNLSEIILVDGHRENTTIQTKAFEKLSLAHPQLAALSSPKGRANQMNAGAQLAKGDILLFLHADSHLPFEWDSEVLSLLNPKCRSGAFSLKIDSSHPFLKWVSFSTTLRSRIHSIPYGDQGIFVDRNLFFEIGMFGEMPLMEDIDLMKKLRKKTKVRISKLKILTSSRRWKKEGYILCTLRNRALSALFTFGVSPNYLAKFYR